MTIEEAAKRFKMDRRTFTKALSRGDFPHARIMRCGRLYRIVWSSLLDTPAPGVVLPPSSYSLAPGAPNVSAADILDPANTTADNPVQS